MASGRTRAGCAPSARRYGGGCLPSTRCRRAMAGSAGALSAHATRFVGLSVLSLLTSGIVTVMLILGGTRRLYGAFVGAAVYYLVQDATAKISPYFWEFVVGLMLIATVLFLEGGLLDLGRVGRRSDRAPAAASGCAMTPSSGTLGSRLVQEFRRARRRPVDRCRPRGRRAGWPDRPERRRQDHVRQPADRISASRRRLDRARRSFRSRR